MIDQAVIGSRLIFNLATIPAQILKCQNQCSPFGKRSEYSKSRQAWGGTRSCRGLVIVR